MLLNGSEGIGTGFSSVIPSFNHKDIIKSMIQYIETGSPRKLKPWVRNYNEQVRVDKNKKIHFKMGFKEISGKIYIVELPRGYDAKKVYKYLNKFIDEDFIKDYIDSSVDNSIMIELLFKRGQQPSLEEVEEKMGTSSSLSPNYTLISERGVKVLDKPEEIIEIFTEQRLVVVKRRYELLILDAKERLSKNKEIIRFIKEKHYAVAEKKANRKAYVEYLVSKKFKYSEYLADMAIYRMTKDEVSKRNLMIKDDKEKIAQWEKIVASHARVKKELIKELEGVDKDLEEIMKKKEAAKKAVYKKIAKKKTRRK